MLALRQRPHVLSLKACIAQQKEASENRAMKSFYVVRELVSVASGQKEFRTHYEYGSFPTYKEANECAIATNNPRCFPQRECLSVVGEEASVN